MFYFGINKYLLQAKKGTNELSTAGLRVQFYFLFDLFFKKYLFLLFHSFSETEVL
uniref:Uncharacterized protein n=1 Tax=Anguilla anguilla TaxID=7936 RepID=A0A0E9T6M0_ANGAN